MRDHNTIVNTDGLDFIKGIKYPVLYLHRSSEFDDIPKHKHEQEQDLANYHLLEEELIVKGTKYSRYIVYGTGKNSRGSIRVYPLFLVFDQTFAQKIVNQRNNISA